MSGDKWVLEAKRIAKRSPQRRFKTGCIVVNHNKIIGTGWSHVGLNLTALYSVHAEIHALLRTHRDFLFGATAYVTTIAVKSGNNATSSCPCKVCAGALYAAGIEKVIYTEGDTVCEMVLNETFIDSCKLYLPQGNIGVAA